MLCLPMIAPCLLQRALRRTLLFLGSRASCMSHLLELPRLQKEGTTSRPILLMAILVLQKLILLIDHGCPRGMIIVTTVLTIACGRQRALLRSRLPARVPLLLPHTHLLQLWRAVNIPRQISIDVSKNIAFYFTFAYRATFFCGLLMSSYVLFTIPKIPKQCSCWRERGKGREDFYFKTSSVPGAVLPLLLPRP